MMKSDDAAKVAVSSVGTFPRTVQLGDALQEILDEPERGILRELLPDLNCRPISLTRVTPADTLAVSLTGSTCELGCRHCRGHYLRHMVPIEALSDVSADTYRSLLISGGSDRRGRVPLTAHAATLAALPKDLPLNLHLGLQDVAALDALAEHRVTVSFELVGSSQVISEVLGLKATPTAYEDAYLRLSERYPTIPHLTVGLGTPDETGVSCDRGEERVLEFLAQHPPPAVVFLAFRPTPGTPMVNHPLPSARRFASLIRQAAVRLPSAIHVGCMRPGRPHRTALDVLAWAAGARTIVQPDQRLVEVLTRIGVPISCHEACCVL